MLFAFHLSANAAWFMYAGVSGTLKYPFTQPYTTQSVNAGFKYLNTRSIKIEDAGMAQGKVWKSEWTSSNAARSILPKSEGAYVRPPAPPLCVEMGFTRTFPRNQDAKVKLKSELISIKF